MPAEVAEVIDALAVGEPIELAALTRITDAAAIEDADARGLTTLEHSGGGEEVRLAHPLYGEVRRKRAAATRLRRLRGLVATELATSAGRDEVPTVVRRATLSLESDLKPDPDLLLRAARGAIWLADMPLADRLAEAATRAGAPAEARFIRTHALSWLDRGEEADSVIAGLADTELSVAVRSIHTMASGQPADFDAVFHPDCTDRENRIRPPSSRVRGPAGFRSTAMWLRAAFADLLT